MRTRPDGVDDEAVVETLERGWGLTTSAIEYAPVGFGGYHWSATTDGGRRFLTVDDLEVRRAGDGTRAGAADRLVAALSTAERLASAGLSFVVGPLVSRSGRVIEPVDDRHVLAVHPHVDGVTGSFGPFADPGERRAVVDRLVQLHRVDVEVPARIDDRSIPARRPLERLLVDDPGDWDTGPYAEPTRDLLARHRQPLPLRWEDLGIG